MTARGPLAARASATSSVAFHLMDSVGTPDSLFAARSPGLHVPLSTLRHALTETSTHDSGPPWVASPSTQSSSISSSMPVYPGAFP